MCIHFHVNNGSCHQLRKYFFTAKFSKFVINLMLSFVVVSEWWWVHQGICGHSSGADSGMVRSCDFYSGGHVMMIMWLSPPPPPLYCNMCRRDSSGRDGLQYVIQVALHLLDPSRPEYSASFVGKFIITFVKVVSEVLTVTVHANILYGTLEWKSDTKCACIRASKAWG